jgi:hypothetical protein
VISPYTQTGKVDSTFYSQVSVLRTIEQIVGIAPMTQFDAAATPMLNAFTNTPNFTPYTAIKPSQNVHQHNPVNAPMADPAVTLDMVATAVDQNEAAENQGIWADYGKGPMPAPKTSLRDISGIPTGDSGDTAPATSPSTAAAQTSASPTQKAVPSSSFVLTAVPPKHTNPDGSVSP